MHRVKFKCIKMHINYLKSHFDISYVEFGYFKSQVKGGMEFCIFSAQKCFEVFNNGSKGVAQQKF